MLVHIGTLVFLLHHACLQLVKTFPQLSIFAASPLLWLFIETAQGRVQDLVCLGRRADSIRLLSFCFCWLLPRLHQVKVLFLPCSSRINAWHVLTKRVHCSAFFLLLVGKILLGVCLALVCLHICLLRIGHFHVESLAAFLTLCCRRLEYKPQQQTADEAHARYGNHLVTLDTLFLCQRLLFLWSLIRLHLVILLLLHVSIHFGWSLAAPCR